MFALRDVRSTIRSCMTSVRSNITSDSSHLLHYCLTWRAYPGLALCAVLYFSAQHMGQEWGGTSGLRQRSGFRFYMSSENGCRTLRSWESVLVIFIPGCFTQFGALRFKVPQCTLIVAMTLTLNHRPAYTFCGIQYTQCFGHDKFEPPYNGSPGPNI